MAKITLNTVKLNQARLNTIEGSNERPLSGLLINISDNKPSAMVLYRDDQSGRYFWLNDALVDKVKELISAIETDAKEF